MSTFRSTFAAQRATSDQLLAKLSHEPRAAAEATRVVKVFFRQLQGSSLFLRFVARRLVRSTITIQRFVRATVLRQCAVVSRVVERWRRSDERENVRSSIAPQLRHVIVKAEFVKQRSDFRIRFRTWLSQLLGALAQHEIAMNDRKRRGSSASSAVRDRAAVLALRIAQLRTLRPKFSFVVDEQHLTTQIDSFLRKETSEKITSVMSNMGIKTTDPAFVSRLVDRYAVMVERERNREEATASRARETIAASQGTIEHVLAKRGSSISAPSTRMVASRRPLGAIISSMSHAAIRAAHAVPPPQPKPQGTPRKETWEPESARAAQQDGTAVLQALGIDEETVPAGERLLLPRPPHAASHRPSHARTRTLSVTNPSASFQSVDTTGPSKRAMIAREAASLTNPPSVAHAHPDLELPRHTAVALQLRQRPHTGHQLPEPVEPEARSHDAGRYVYPGFQNPICTSSVPDDEEAARQEFETQAIMKLPGAWTDGRRAFRNTTQLMLSDVSLTGLSRFHQVDQSVSPAEDHSSRITQRARAPHSSEQASHREDPTDHKSAQIALSDALISTPSSPLTCCALVPAGCGRGPAGGAVVVGSMTGDVLVFDLSDHARLGILRCSDRVSCLCVAFEGGCIVAGCDDGSVSVMQFGSDREHSSRVSSQAARFYQVAQVFHQRSWVSSVASIAEDCVAVGGYEALVYVYNVGSRPRLLQTFSGHFQRVSCVTSFTGGRFASGSVDGTVRVWSLADAPAASAELRVYGECTAPVERLEWLQDNLLVCASIDYTVRIFDGVNMQTAATFKMPASLARGIPLLEVTGPGTVLLASTNGAGVVVANVFTGRTSLDVELPSGCGLVTAILSLPGGVAVASTSAGMSLLLDLTSGGVVGSLSGSNSQPGSSRGYVGAMSLASRPGEWSMSSTVRLQEHADISRPVVIIDDSRQVRVYDTNKLRSVQLSHTRAIV